MLAESSLIGIADNSAGRDRRTRLRSVANFADSTLYLLRNVKYTANVKLDTIFVFRVRIHEIRAHLYYVLAARISHVNKLAAGSRRRAKGDRSVTKDDFFFFC